MPTKNQQTLSIQLLPGDPTPSSRLLEGPLGPGADAVPLEDLANAEELEALGTEIEEALDSYFRAKGNRETEAEAVRRLQERLGRKLFDDLLPESDPYLSRSLAEVEQGEPMPVRLVWDPSNADLNPLGALPWELLYQARRRRFFARSSATPLHRFLTSARRVTPRLAPDGPLRVLLVAAMPKGLGHISALEEAAAIGGVLDCLEGVQVRSCEPRLEAIRDSIADSGFHVLHLMGHGGFDDETGEGRVVLETERGEADRIHGPILAEFLSTTELPSLSLVVLSTCHGAAVTRRAGENALAAVAPALIAEAGVPAVIAMQYMVSNLAAVTFSRRLYQRLAAGDPVDAAVALARRSLWKDPATRPEWATPALFSRVRDGRLFADREVAPAEEADRPEGARTPLRLAVRSFWDGWAAEVCGRTDRCLELQDHFVRDGREILDPRTWNGVIVDRLRETFEPLRPAQQAVDLYPACHLSITFTLGHILEAKSGMRLRIWQSSQIGGKLWHAQDGRPPEGRLWRFQEETLDEDEADVALVVSVSQSALDDVLTYRQESGLGFRRVIEAQPWDGFDQLSVKNGIHALRLAQQLATKIRQRTMTERRGRLHLFLAGPATLAFYLGQYSRAFGAIQLYEHPYGRADAAGRYQPSIVLPFGD